MVFMSLVIDLITRDIKTDTILFIIIIQVVETLDTVTNSSFQNYTHPDDYTRQT